MARNTTLANLRTMLKGVLAVEGSSQVAPGGDNVMNAQLAGQQQWLASEYDWPFLELRQDINMVPAQRYYDFPNAAGVPVFNMEREIIAECYWSTLWYTVMSGIKLINYNTLNPELGQRLDPVMRWQPYNGAPVAPVTTSTAFEVWPLPATPTRLRLTGQRALNPMVQDTDKADLDDMLIVLFTAAELCARYTDQAAGAIAKRAQMRLDRLRAGIAAPNQVFSLKGNKGGSRQRTDVDRPMVGVNLTPPL